MTLLAPLILVALQAAAVPATPPVPQKFSILAPIDSEPCTPARKQAGRQNGAPPDDDVVVCGNPLPSQKLPYPDEIPGGPTPVNPFANGVGALNAEGTPCAAHIGGCQVGVGPPIMPIAKALVGLAKNAFHKKPDKAGRIAIPLDDAPRTGAILP